MSYKKLMFVMCRMWRTGSHFSFAEKYHGGDKTSRLRFIPSSENDSSILGLNIYYL